MKAVILAGGFGTRISEETTLRPKPMIEIGGRPILWHIMKLYSHHQVNDFIICCGYLGHVIKEYFANYFLHMSDVSFDMRENRMSVHSRRAEPWSVTLVDTGETSNTGGRIKRVSDYLEKEDCFLLTYGDGVSDISITDSIAFHRGHGKRATVSAVFPPARFGALDIKDGVVRGFEEKPRGDGARINGGFFVLSPDILDYIDGEDTVWEKGPMRSLATEGQIMPFLHDGFWHPMDTLRDKNRLDQLWRDDQAPWRVWHD